MTEGIFLSLSAAVVYAFMGITFESAGKRRYNVWDIIFWKQLVGLRLCLAGAAFLHGPWFSSRLLLLGLMAAASYILTLAAYLLATRDREISANWTIVNLSLILPILVSVFWFKDPFSWTKGIGLLLTLVSIILIGGGLHRTVGGDLQVTDFTFSWRSFSTVGWSPSQGLFFKRPACRSTPTFTASACCCWFPL